jgi:preprotein translocase subunit YajC
MLYALLLLAEDKPKGGEPSFSPLILMLGIFFLFWLVVLRPIGRRQQHERDSMLANLKKNDKILTSSGIYGTVVTVSDTADEVTIKVDDNVRLRMVKASIARNLTREEEAKAQKTAAKEGAA